MIYIENTSHDPTWNLAFEEYAFTKLDYDEPILLLWQNGPSVIIGRYQNTLEEINYDFIRENGISVVRRNTGGGAVYHDLGNLNYSFIIPDVESKVDFRTFTIPVVKALQSYGIPAEQTGRNDILADGKKFSGNAQQFSRGRLLHHGTLMFDVHMENVAKALQVKEGKFRSKATKSVRSRVTNLKPLFAEQAKMGTEDATSPVADGGSAAQRTMGEAAPKRPAEDVASTGTSDGTSDGIPAGNTAGMTVEDFKALLLDWFGREYELKEVKLTDVQLEEIRKLQQEKYSTDEWNYGRSPKADVVRGDFFRCGHVEFHFSIAEHRITAVEIRGDFFASRDIEELEQRLVGLVYDKPALLQALQEADLHSYLGDVTAEELVDVIV